MTTPSVSVVVPAYNEESRIAPTLERIAAYFESSSISCEILVVDDGSTDATIETARAVSGPIRVVSLGENRGKGAAVRAGVMESSGNVILWTDADLSTPIEQWEPICAKLGEGFDIVIGSRAHAESRIEVRQPWYRERMGKIFNWIMRRVLPLGLKDTQCGFKLFDAIVAKTLFGTARIDGFAFDAEILLLAKRFGYRVGELPVPWFNSLPSRVHAIWHSLQMLKDLLRIRVYDLTGAYSSHVHGEVRG